jgi:hypothetical protein
VRADGSIVVEHTRYYVGRRLAGQRVAVAVSAAERTLVVYHGDTLLKQLPCAACRGRSCSSTAMWTSCNAKLAPKHDATTAG